MRNLVKLMLAGAGLVIFAASAIASNGHLPALDLYKAFISTQSEAGWVVFQNRADRQVLHFIPIVGYTCGIAEVRYSVNSDALDRQVDMPECDGTYLLHVPRFRPEILASVDLAPGTAESVSMQITFTDGTQTELRRFAPCSDVGVGVCSQTLMR